MRRVHHGRIRGGYEVLNFNRGLNFGNIPMTDGTLNIYWREGPFYDFAADEVDRLENAGRVIYEMLMEAGDVAISRCPRNSMSRAQREQDPYNERTCDKGRCWLSSISIPPWAHDQIIRTWHDDSANTWCNPGQTPDFSPTIYGGVGRLDLAYGGEWPPKLLEVNAQTPLSLVESAEVQWGWLEDTGQSRHEYGQWNSIWDRLVGWEHVDWADEGPYEGAIKANMNKLRAARPHFWRDGRPPKVFFAFETTGGNECRMNTAYLQHAFIACGFETELIAMSQIGWRMEDDQLVFRKDPNDESDPGEDIQVIFMLYPWKWAMNEEIGKPAFRGMARADKSGTVFMEPPYTAALFNKAILVLLWELYGPGGPLADPEKAQYLLPTYMYGQEPAGFRDNCAIKPIWSYEGMGIKLIKDGKPIGHVPDTYHIGGQRVVQQLHELPTFEAVEHPEGVHPVIGLWFIHGEPAGIGIREGDGPAGLITDRKCSFVPHTVGSHL